MQTKQKLQGSIFFFIFSFSILVMLSLLYTKPIFAADIFPDHLYSADSPWNQPIGTNVQIDQNSSSWVNSISGGRHVATVFGFGMPIYVSTASDPMYRVSDGDKGSDGAFAKNNPFHIPDSAAPAPGFGSDADHWMFVYDTTTNVLHEMWFAQKNGNTWTTKVANAFSPTGDGVLQTDGSHTDGNGASYFGGVVRHADITRGYINHALSLVIPNTASAFRYPLWASDGHGSGSNSVPEGVRFQLDPTFDCNSMSGASKGEIMVCKAFQTYGGYIQDSGAGGGTNMTIYFEGEDLNDPNRRPPTNPGDGGRSGGPFGAVGISDNTDFPHIPWNKLRALAAWNSYTALPPSSSSSSSNENSSSSTAPSGNASVSVALFLPGVGGIHGGNAHPTQLTRTIQLLLYTPTQDPANLGDKPIIVSAKVQLNTLQGTPTYGYFTNTNIPLGNLSGPYQIFVKINQYLKTPFTGTATSSDNTFTLGGDSIIHLPQLTLVPGDSYPPIANSNGFFGDGILDISDYNTLISCFGQKINTPTCPSYKAADLNDDGVVNGLDYNLLLRSFYTLQQES